MIGCSLCGRGTFQAEYGYLGEECQECPPGTWAGGEGAAECDACDKPICAKELLSCDPYHGNSSNFSYYSPFEAPHIFCKSNASETDVCFEGYPCVHGSATCAAEPTIHPLHLTFNDVSQPVSIAIDRSLGSDGGHGPQAQGGGGGGGGVGASVIGACPSLHGDGDGGACWDQEATLPRNPTGKGTMTTTRNTKNTTTTNTTGQLLYSSVTKKHTVIVPSSIGMREQERLSLTACPPATRLVAFVCISLFSPWRACVCTCRHKLQPDGRWPPAFSDLSRRVPAGRQHHTQRLRLCRVVHSGGGLDGWYGVP